MREIEKDPLRIDHMIEASRNVLDFMKGKTFDELQNDKILYFAVVKNIEILGEAAFMLTKEFKQAHSEIPWKNIEGMRHVLVHDYYKISPQEIYKVSNQEIPALLDQLKDLKLP